MNPAGLRTDQAPPFLVPASFFLTAPIALIAAGALLFTAGPEALTSNWSPSALALLHLGTLGFAGATALGALYQLAPVVGGAPVPWVRLAHAVHAAFVIGAAALAWGLHSGSAPAFRIALFFLAPAMLGHLAPVAAALARAPSRTTTVAGMRLALFALALVAGLGLFMTYRRGGPGYLPSWIELRLAHGSLALIGFLGGLITSVSWQVVPMFYLTPPFPRLGQRIVLMLVTASTVAIPAALALGAGERALMATAMPGALAVWLLHPIFVLRAIAARRRKRQDPSLSFWKLGMACAPLALAAAAAVAIAPEAPRPPVLFAFIVLWGWAGSVIHGMLSRIVPFLVWFHRFASLAGRAPMPTMRQLLPEERVRRGLYLHAATLGAGLIAIETQHPLATRLAGVGLAATGSQMLAMLAGILRHRGAAPRGLSFSDGQTLREQNTQHRGSES